MLMGRVEGSVVATVKIPGLAGAKLLLVQPVTSDGDPTGSPVVAEDVVGAGQGETVLLVTGGSARAASNTNDGAIDAVVVAIVDEVHA